MREESNIDENIYLETYRPKFTLTDHDIHIIECACSNDSKYMISASTDNQLRIWNLSKRRCVDMIYVDNLKGCTYSNDNKYIVSYGIGGNIDFWLTRTHKHVKNINIDDAWIYSCSFSHDNLRMISCGISTPLTIWDLNKIAADEFLIKLDNKMLSNHDLVIKHDIKDSANNLQCIYAKDNKYIVHVTTDSQIIIRNASNFDLIDVIETLPIEDNKEAVPRLSNNSKYLVHIDKDKDSVAVISSFNGYNKLKMEKLIALQECCITAFCFTNDSKYLIIIQDYLLTLVELETYEIIKTIICLDKVRTCLATSDGKSLIMYSTDRMSLYDLPFLIS